MSMRPVYPYKWTDPIVCSRFDLRVESATLIRCGNTDYANRRIFFLFDSDRGVNCVWKRLVLRNSFFPASAWSRCGA